MRKCAFMVLILVILIVSLFVDPAVYPISAAAAYLLAWWRIRYWN